MDRPRCGVRTGREKMIKAKLSSHADDLIELGRQSRLIHIDADGKRIEGLSKVNEQDKLAWSVWGGHQDNGWRVG